MKKYCKKCRCQHPHVKAGFSNDRQIFQCKNCKTRTTDPAGKKKTPSYPVAIRLDKWELEKLNNFPGENRSDKLRFALTKIGEEMSKEVDESKVAKDFIKDRPKNK